MLPCPTDATPREAGAEPIAGYRLVDRLGSGGYGEVWRCVAPGGFPKAIKFVRGPDPESGRGAVALTQELSALERLKALRHPYLLGLDRAEVCGPDLLMVMELADKTLHHRFAECTAAGQPGLPRREFLLLAAEAAEALDLLTAHGLQHLDVKPANLFLVGGHLKVGDFGLLGAIGGPRPLAADALAGITPKYVAPEVLQGAVAAATDQYALALVAYELLTGQFPYPVRSAQQLLVAHMSGTPNLSAVSPPEAAVLARALAKDPAARFASCREFVRRLAAAGRSAAPLPATTPPAAADEPTVADTGVVTGVTLPGAAAPVDLPVLRMFSEMGRAREAAPPEFTVEELVRGMIRVCLLKVTAVPSTSGTDLTDLFCRFPVRADRSALTEKLKAFTRKWGATPEAVTDDSCALVVTPPAGWLRRLVDQSDPVKLVVTLPQRRRAGRGEVTAVAIGCGGRKDAGHHPLAVAALAELRAVLVDDREDRRAPRYPVETPVVIYPVGPDGRVAAGIEARCIDLSTGGAKIESAFDPCADRFYLRFPGHPTAARCGVLCSVLRRSEPGPEHYGFGCRFPAP